MTKFYGFGANDSLTITNNLKGTITICTFDDDRIVSSIVINRIDIMHYFMAIPINEMIDGAMYVGICRNATNARWNAEEQVFYHDRVKFGNQFVEKINHFENDNNADLFYPMEQIEG